MLARLELYRVGRGRSQCRFGMQDTENRRGHLKNNEFLLIVFTVGASGRWRGHPTDNELDAIPKVDTVGELVGALDGKEDIG